MGRPVSDFDIVVAGDVKEYAGKLALKLQGRMIHIGKPHQAVIRIVTKKGNFDVLPLSGDSIEEDLSKRDFTVNAMAYHVSSGTIIDRFNGLKDLKDKTIRMINGEVFRNDPIRLLRAYRMAACFGFKIAADTVSAIQKDAVHIRNSAGERVREEILKILKDETSHSYICHMAESGLLYALIPELRSLRDCSQNAHHRYDVFDHTLKAYDFLETSINTLDHDFPEWSGSLFRAIQGDRIPFLKWAILLHDIGKPAVRTVESDGRIHFYHHSSKSAETAEKINHRIRLSKKDNRFVLAVVEQHTYPLSLFTAHLNQSLTTKGLTRMFIQCGSLTPCILLHSLADMRGKGKIERSRRFHRFIQGVLSAFYVDYVPKTLEKPLITGHDLIRVLGFSPSPLFKTILAKVEEARLSGSLKNKNEAIQFAKSIQNTKFTDVSS